MINQFGMSPKMKWGFYWDENGNLHLYDASDYIIIEFDKSDRSLSKYNIILKKHDKNKDKNELIKDVDDAIKDYIEYNRNLIKSLTKKNVRKIRLK